MSFLDPIFNPVLIPLLSKSPFLGILIISLLLALLTSLVYKFFTNQEEMKRLKEEQKVFQKQMKELKEHPEELMRIQKEAMKSNMEYMKHSFKASLITLLPLLIIFSWMTAHLSYEPIFPGEKYSLTAQFAPGVGGEAEIIINQGTTLLSEAKQEVEGGHATWRLQSEAGEHILTVKGGTEQQSKKVFITKQLQYEAPISTFQDSEILSLRINYNELRPLGDFSLFGWKPGWLGWYILLSLLFSLGLRKLLKIY